MTVRLLSEKAPEETVSCTMDFAPVLVGSESVSGHTCSVSLYVGTAEPSGMLQGATSLSGAVVSQVVTGGTAAHVYRLRFGVSTSSGRFLIASSFLPIDEDD